MRRWLVDPALPAWWGTRSAVEAEMTLALESGSAMPRIIERAGEPAGYGHAADATLWGGDLPPDVTAGHWSIGVFVAAPQTRPADTTAAIRLLADEIFATTMAVGCCSLVSIRNESAARAFERAGFRWQRIWHDRHSGPSWVLELPRPR